MKSWMDKKWNKATGTARILAVAFALAVAFIGSLHALLPFVNSLGTAQNTVFPKVISPNGDGINDRLFFVFDNPTAAPSKGTIYDLRAQKVADAQESLLFVANSIVLTWDGRDETGATVPAGVYIYKVEIGDKMYSGTVGVAR